MFMEAIEADFEFVTKPFTKVHDVATETIHTVLDAATATKKRVGGFLNKIIN